LTAPVGERASLVREMWAPLAGMYDFVPGGVDMADIHRQNFGFDWEGPTDQLQEGVDRLVEADAWNRVTVALEAGISALLRGGGASGLPDAPNLPDAPCIPDLTVLLLLGDPSNSHFLDEVQGLSAFGGISGYITVTVWPTPQVLERLEAIVVHELHHNVRYSPGGVVWDPTTVTVGEQVIAEGLADLFAVEMYGERGHTHFVSEATRGSDEVLAKVTDGLGIAGMQHFTAWVHGDASARLFGAEPVGLPTGAGYAAGARLVAAYLSERGVSAAQAVAAPSDDIARVATRRLGLATNLQD
nr:peptidase [Leucobacter sp.]